MNAQPKTGSADPTPGEPRVEALEQTISTGNAPA
jgi:hypothetical protein